jgi:hypothetical protein
MRSPFACLCLLLALQSGVAQNIKGRIVDSKTGESIPYANITLNGTENLVSNEEGYFSLPEDTSSDTSALTVSYLGYLIRQMTVGDLKSQQNIIRLEPGIVELKDVAVERPDPYKIMATVKKNLENNYKTRGKSSKDMLFYRQSIVFKPKKLDFPITKSTGFTKANLKAANSDITAFTSGLISQPPQEFTDILCNYYTGTTTVKDKPASLAKMEVVKATKIRNEARSASLEELQKTATNLLMKHLDSTKYYRVKSGLFGSHDTISLRKDFRSKKKAKTSQLSSAKSNLNTFMIENNALHSAELDFIKQPDWYEYTYEGATYSNENEFVYILSFKPDKSKAKYTGKIYISEIDYAVIRVDYTLDDGETMDKFNLKLLLGVKTLQNVAKGTIIYKKNSSGEGYYLQYAAKEEGRYFYVNRPLKFIELTDKDDEDVVAFDLKVEGNTRNKTEFLNISHTEVPQDALENLSEKDFNYTILKYYDPNIWKNYSAIEPLEEMKQFRVVN